MLDMDSLSEVFSFLQTKNRHQVYMPTSPA